MKQLKDRLPGQVDAALDEHARVAEGWATIVRLIFVLTFAASAAWMWKHPSAAKYIYVQLAAAWLIVVAVGALVKRSSDANVTMMTMLDLT
ncbi:MAG: hypothetical protein L0Y75_05730, partial [Acidobacteria bacterium]|nr:hypothetical protein [Acidobacteriota bacterium]